MKNYTWVLGCCAIFMAACSSNTTTPYTDKYQVINPILADTAYQNEYVAEINALQNVEIRSRIKGFIDKIYVDEGQTVNQGQLLFTINSREFLQELAKAQAFTKSAIAEAKSAEIELENVQKLSDKNIISKPELEMLRAKAEALKAKVAEAKATEAQAELNLSFTRVTAPFTGIINRIPNKAGSLVDEGALLTSISNNNEVFAYFNVSEIDYYNYIADQSGNTAKKVELLLANNSKYPQQGVIETTESEFDKSTGNIAFRAKFPNPNQLLKHGSSGKVLVKTQLQNALLIPQKTTFEVQENVYVFVVDKLGKVNQRKVQIAARLPHLYVISAGLSVSDKILFEGIQKVKEGDKIVAETRLLSQISNL